MEQLHNAVAKRAPALTPPGYCEVVWAGTLAHRRSWGPEQWLWPASRPGLGMAGGTV